MNNHQISDLLLMMSNMTSSLSKISIHMEEIVEKLDSIDNNMVYMINTLEDIKEEDMA